jgi:processive 1,2-diacylglycerol beta-glucosyltransferase
MADMEREPGPGREEQDEAPPGSGEPAAPPPEAQEWAEEIADRGEPQRFDPDSGDEEDKGVGVEESVEELERGAPEPRRPRPERPDRERRRRRRSGPDSEVEELGASSGIDVLELPSERGARRPGALEPGLTLKDLLPFLRPPRTVLVLGATTGNGHNRSAAALVEAFKGLDRNLIVRDADVIDLLDRNFRPAFVRALLDDLARHPAAYGTPFETIEPAEERAIPSEIDDVVEKGLAERFDQVAVERKPDHLVLTHWLPLKRLEVLKAEGRFAAAVTVVLPEPDLSLRWVSSVVDNYFVASEHVKDRLLRHGVDPNRVQVSGVPVSPAFAAAFDREQTARELGLRPQTPTLLLRPGGIGSAERILGVVRGFLDAQAPMNLLVVAGKNERLREEIQALEVPRACLLKAFGFVDNIRDLMGVSDLLVTRASPHTVAEANAAGVPLILLRPSPGIEDRMADRMVAKGCALKAYGDEDLDLIVKELVRNRRALQEMQEAARRQMRPDAAIVTADRISRLVR